MGKEINLNVNEIEKKRLDGISAFYSSYEGFEGQLLKYRTRVLMSLANGENVLELGCADGYMTRFLVKKFKKVTAIDSSQRYLNFIKRLNLGNNLILIKSLFEKFQPKEQYDLIIASHVLEHVIDPVLLLKKIHSWLVHNGYILIAVPNAGSLHRRIGQSMGILKKFNDLSETDIKVGHRRVYTKDLLLKHIEESGLKIDMVTGIFLKPLSNSQMESWDQKVIDALFEVGKSFPDLCAQLCVRCKE